MRFPALFASVPDELVSGLAGDRPWDLLGQPLDDLFGALPGSAVETRLSPEVTLLGDRIVIGKGARIHPGVVIEGPVVIGDDVLIRSGVYIRGGSWVGGGSVVGANTELKRAVLLPGAKVPHLSYVGDSIVGSGANLGAGTILSNFRHDGGEIEIPTDGGRMASGRRKLGAVLGDDVKTGCNCVLSPGVVVGRGTRIYAGVVLRPGIYPEDSIIKLRQEQIVVPRRP